MTLNNIVTFGNNFEQSKIKRKILDEPKIQVVFAAMQKMIVHNNVGTKLGQPFAVSTNTFL